MVRPASHLAEVMFGRGQHCLNQRQEAWGAATTKNISDDARTSNVSRNATHRARGANLSVYFVRELRRSISIQINQFANSGHGKAHEYCRDDQLGNAHSAR